MGRATLGALALLLALLFAAAFALTREAPLPDWMRAMLDGLES
jgi:hypothetical protein